MTTLSLEKQIATVQRISHLHPASLSLRAYILPMSPIPMIPTTKESIIPWNLFGSAIFSTSPAASEEKLHIAHASYWSRKSGNVLLFGSLEVSLLLEVWELRGKKKVHGLFRSAHGPHWLVLAYSRTHDQLNFSKLKLLKKGIATPRSIQQRNQNASKESCPSRSGEHLIGSSSQRRYWSLLFLQSSSSSLSDGNNHDEPRWSD